MRILFGITLVAISVFYFMQEDAPIGNVDIVVSEPIVDVKIPEYFSIDAYSGKEIFEENCIHCHGRHAEGRQEVAPPLIHKIYEPSHHGDESFQRAVAQGVKAHHWKFGNMPAISHLTRDDVNLIVVYIRELQVFNDINYE